MSLFVLNETYTNGFYSFFLVSVSLLSILSGILVIIAKNPIVSVLFLISLFFSIAAYLMILGVNFIGLSYLLVYVGAVSILFLFILMLINVRVSELITNNRNSFLLAILIGTYLLVPMYDKGNVYTVGKDEYEFSTNGNAYALSNKVNYYIFESLNKLLDSINNKVYFVTSQSWDGILGDMPHISNIGSIIYTNYPIWLILTSIILLLAMVGAIIITIKK